VQEKGKRENREESREEEIVDKSTGSNRYRADKSKHQRLQRKESKREKSNQYQAGPTRGKQRETEERKEEKEKINWVKKIPSTFIKIRGCWKRETGKQRGKSSGQANWVKLIPSR
jgi:hypothetical protein